MTRGPMRLLMRRMNIALAIIVFGMIFSGCGAKEKTGEVTEQQNVGMPNPIVLVNDDEEFSEQLGIAIDKTKLPAAPEMSIIAGKMAQCDFCLTNVENVEVTCSLRATKDGEMAENMHGIYDEDMSEPVVISQEFGDETIDYTCLYANTEGYTIYTWTSSDGVHYSLTFDGEMSQMQIGAVLDAVMIATGIAGE